MLISLLDDGLLELTVTPAQAGLLRDALEVLTRGSSFSRTSGHAASMEAALRHALLTQAERAGSYSVLDLGGTRC